MDRIGSCQNNAQKGEESLMRKRSIGIAAFVLAIALVAGVVLGRGNFAPQIAQAQTEMDHSRTVTVVGEGVVKIKPDIAQVTISVEVVKPTVKEASGEANAIIDSVMAALSEAGVEEKDIQTSGFSIWVERVYGPDGSFDDEQNRYHVNNSVFATLRDLETVGAILDSAIEAGANNILWHQLQPGRPQSSGVRRTSQSSGKC
jgi:uncharacterized protein YggE